MANEPCGITCIDTGLHNIFRYDGSGADHHLITDGNRQDGGIGTYRHMVADPGRPPPFRIPLRRPAGREKIVDKHNAMSDEAVVPDLNQLADKGMRLDFAIISYPAIPLYLYKRADEAMIAYLATI